MEGKNCISKAKTQPVRRTTAPLIQQRMAFAETPKNKMLQVKFMFLKMIKLKKKFFSFFSSKNLLKIC